jgi:hypothetical protein
MHLKINGLNLHLQDRGNCWRMTAVGAKRPFVRKQHFVTAVS